MNLNNKESKHFISYNLLLIYIIYLLLKWKFILNKLFIFPSKVFLTKLKLGILIRLRFHSFNYFINPSGMGFKI
jgi:hypothetical protein